MSSAKLALATGLAALSLAACGSTAKPEAGTLKADTKVHKGIDDPRKKRLQCLQQDHIPAMAITLSGQPAIQVGAYPQGPRIVFAATPGIAQGMQIQNQVQSAEIIGSALLYPNAGSDGLLKQVENCVAEGVQG
jgi:hypothetical protein